MRAALKHAVVTAAFLVVFGIVLTASADATLMALQVGMDGPEFSLGNLAGGAKSFSDVRGDKLTILVFWSTWSAKSTMVLARMQKLYDAYKTQGLSVVGINVDGQNISDATLSDIRALQDKMRISYSMLVDYGLAAFHDYGVIAVPTTIVMNRDRVIKYELSGYPIVGSEMMVDFVVSDLTGKKPELAPKKTGYQPKINALRLYNMGMTTLKSKRMTDTAEMWLKKACEADPNFVLPHLSLGRIYARKGDSPLAQAEFKAVLAGEPENPIALCESGILLVNEGKTHEGSGLFEAARKAEESYAPCYYYAGYAYGKEGKTEEAMKMFEEAERVNPLDYNIQVYKGRFFEERKNLGKAVEAYRKALEKVLPKD